MYEDTKLMLEAAARKEAKQSYNQSKERLAYLSEAADRAAIWNKLNSRNRVDYSYIDYKKKLTDAYVTEGLVAIVDNCLNPVLVREQYHQKLVRQLVTNFVNEEGSMKLLKKFRGTSYIMSEMAYIIETTVESILERADKDNPESFKPDKKDKDKFYDKLSKIEVGDAVDKITDRVQDQAAEFMNTNMSEKAELAASLSKTQKKVENNKQKLAEKVNSKKEQEKAAKIEEGYIALGKRRATDIRNSKTKNVLEQMVYTLSKAAIVNESAGKVFVDNSRLNMDKIVEHCETICTFVTALDSLKIINVDEAYIEKMLKDMKK
nr:MAG TPA: hypothetical protein [Caudoviricetes sp.]